MSILMGDSLFLHPTRTPWCSRHLLLLLLLLALLALLALRLAVFRGFLLLFALQQLRVGAFTFLYRG